MGLFFRRGKKSSAQYHLQCLDALYHGDVDRAIQAFTEAVSHQTEEPIPYLWLGKLLLNRKEYARAETIYENLARRHRLPKPIQAAAWRGVAECAKAMKHDDKVVMALGFYSSSAPKDSLGSAEYLYAKAQQALSLQNPQGAINYLRQSIKEDKRFGASYILLGDLVGRDSPRRSLRIWRRLLKLRPDLIEILAPKIQDTYSSLGSTHRYERFLVRLASRVPPSGYPSLLLGRFYLTIKETEHARLQFERAKECPPTRHLAMLELIKLQVERWDPKEAVDATNNLLAEAASSQLIWNCGACGFEKAVLFLTSCPKCGNWVDLRCRTTLAGI
ncbi:MAG TPA: tetratricopeptide repeat protein [Bdellovibrionota bacterium]|nr:tetratricopeptide repeat protein [Bdellovibrionota bacterium]